jgi:agmatinase
MKLTPPTTQHYEGFEPAVSFQSNAVNLIGFGFDGTACFRKGTKDGPDAIRSVSEGIEFYSPYLDKDLETFQGKLFDLGNLPVGTTDNADHDWKQATDAFFELITPQQLLDGKIKTVLIGGEHSVSYAPIKTYLDAYPDLVLLHLDAHADLRDGYNGHHYSHASIIRRSLDHFKDTHTLIQYGIRSGTSEEYQWMRANKTNRESLDDFIQSVEAIPDEQPIYLTLDLDYFDPAYLPGTGTPEAGGETFHSFIRLIKILNKKNFVGADIVELSPSIDPTGNSSVFATKVVRETVLALL